MRSLLRLTLVVSVVTMTGMAFAGTFARLDGLPEAHDSDIEGKPKIESQDVTLIDGNGDKVGKVLDARATQGSVLVPIKVSGVRTIIQVSSSVIEQSYESNSNAVYFESSDCSGQPLVQVSDFLTPATAVAPPGQTLYAQDDGTVGAEFLLGSFLQNQNTCQPTDGAVFAVPGHAVVRLDLLAPPPYRLKLD